MVEGRGGSTMYVLYIGSVVEVGLAQMVVEMDVQVHILK